MTSDEPDLHIAFSTSLAASLRQAFQEIGRTDEVLCPFDNFSFGPIDSDDPDARVRWVEETLGYSDWADVAERNPPFLHRASQARKPPVVWVSFNIASCYAGFLWFLSHIGDAPCKILNENSLPFHNSDQLKGLLGRERMLDQDDRGRHLACWARLKSENAALRVIEGGNLVSAGLDYFDPLLINLATPQWRKMALIVGYALVSFSDADIYQTGDLVLGARLADLAEDGVLEWRGDLSIMRACELRLPPSQAQ